jgi:glutathione S-transferase
MKLYSAALSLFGRKVEIALHEKALEFTRDFVPFSQLRGYQPKHPAVLAANPKARVPVFVEGDLTLYESTIIIEYLEDAYPDPPLYPPDPAERAMCRQWEAFADEVMIEPLAKLMFRTEPPGPRRAEQEAEAARAEPVLAGHFAALETALDGHEHPCGAFTAADIALYMAVLFGIRLGFPPVGFPALEAWHARLARRPAFATVTAEIAAADRVLSYPWIG